jgi:hypothetical protein
LQAILREQGLQAAVDGWRTVDRHRPAGPGEAGPVGPVRSARRDPVRQEPAPRQGSESHVADSGRVVRVSSGPVTNTSRHDVTMVGRARPSSMAHPIRSAKSKIVPEPDQIWSEPPGRRRSSPLEPPGY